MTLLNQRIWYLPMVKMTKTTSITIATTVMTNLLIVKTQKRNHRNLEIIPFTEVICTSTEPASVPQNATPQQEGHPLKDTSSNKASASIPPTPPSLTLNSPQVPSSQQPSSPQLATSQQPGPTVTPQEKNAQPVSASEPRVMTAAEV